MTPGSDQTGDVTDTMWSPADTEAIGLDEDCNPNRVCRNARAFASMDLRKRVATYRQPGAKRSHVRESSTPRATRFATCCSARRRPVDVLVHIADSKMTDDKGGHLRQNVVELTETLRTAGTWPTAAWRRHCLSLSSSGARCYLKVRSVWANRARQGAVHRPGPPSDPSPVL